MPPSRPRPPSWTRRSWNGRPASAWSSPTTIRCSAKASCAPSASPEASRSWPRPPTARPRSRSSAATSPTSPSSTCGCPASTASTSSTRSRAPDQTSPWCCCPRSTTRRSNRPGSTRAPPHTSPRAPTATRSAPKSRAPPREHRSPSAIHGLPDLHGPRLQGWSPRLTSREHRLLQLANGGWDKPELALLCGIDEPTLRRRLASALAKLGADDLTQGLEIARSQGIVR